MAVYQNLLDDNDIAFEITELSELDVFSLNLETGVATSEYLPPLWLQAMTRRASVFIEKAGALFDLEERRRGALNFLQRFVNVSPLDDSALSLSVTHVGNVYTLVANVTIYSGNPAHLVVNLPHSLSGSVAMASAVTSAGGGGGSVVTLAGEVIGLSNANSVAPGVINNSKVANDAGIAQAKIAGLVDALATKALKTVSFTGTGPVTGGGTLEENRTFTLVDHTTAGSSGGVSGNTLTIPVITVDQYGRVSLGTAATYTVSTDYVPSNTKSYVKLTAPLDAAPGDWATVSYAPVINNASGSTSMQQVALQSSLAAVVAGIKYLEPVVKTFTTSPTDGDIAALNDGDRILLAVGSNVSNGVYIVNTPKTVANLTRSSDMPAGFQATGSYIFDSTTGISYLCNSSTSADTVGTDPLTFIQYSSSPVYTAGTGMSAAQLAAGSIAIDTAIVAQLASPAFTGNPTAPTPSTGDNATSIATTAFVKAQGYVTSAAIPSAGTTATTPATANTGGSASTWSRSDHAHGLVGIPADFSGEIAGTPAPTTEVFHFAPVRLTSVDSSGHIAIARAAATGSAVVMDIATVIGGAPGPVGTITFNVGSTTGIVSFPGATLDPANGDFIYLSTRAGPITGLSTPFFTFKAALA